MLALIPQSKQGGVLTPSWRVLIAVPPTGFGTQLAVMCAWLDQSCGPKGWTSAPAGQSGIVNDAIAFYFVDRKAARAFVERFSCGYRSVAGPEV